VQTIRVLQKKIQQHMRAEGVPVKSIAIRLLSVAAALWLAPVVSPHAAVVFTSLGYGDFPATEFWDINNAGTIVGRAYSAERQTGFVFSNGVFTEISGPPGAIGSLATGITESGTIVGSWFGPDFRYRGFMLENGVYSVIDALGGTTIVRGVSPNGRFVTGQWSLPGQPVQGAFLYNRNDQTMRRVGTANNAVAQGVNDRGMVVGSETVGASRQSFIYDLSTFTTTIIPSSGDLVNPALRGIDPTGTVFSGFGIDAINPLWGQIGVFGPLEDFDIFQAFGSNQTTPYGFNDQGQLVGFYATNAERTQYRAFIATNTVAEPKALFLALCSLLVVFAGRYPAGVSSARELPR
jgi:hypothetical protein